MNGGKVERPSELRMAYGGFTPDWKEHLADYMSEHFDKKEDTVQHFDEGTPSVGDDFEVGGGDTTTPVALTQPPPVMPAPPPPTFNPQAGLPPPSAPLAPQVAAPLAPSSTPTGPSDISNYLDQQKADLAKYGPEQQMAVEQQILNQRQGLGSKLASAGGGFADALMQGVARAGPSHFQENIENQQNKTQQGLIDAMEKAQTGKLAQTQENMKLDAKNPTSSLSKIAQNSERPTLKKLGWTDDEINKTSAETIVDASKNSLTYADVQAQIGLKGQIAEQQADIQRQGLGVRRQEANTKDQTLKVEHPIGSFLANNMPGGGNGSPSAASVGPLGPETMRNGIAYEWSPVSGKYHPKGQ